MEAKTDIKVLVISHNVFGRENAMGKTLASMLSLISPGNLSQLYFHTEIPTVSMCENYFRVTDVDVLRSIYTGKTSYRIFTSDDIKTDAPRSRVDSGFLAKVYQLARKRTPFIYLMRELLWAVGKWDSAQLRSWIKEQNPDVIFFASGDYTFSYKIAKHISDSFNIPIVLYCCDDYYLGRWRKKNPFEAIYYKKLMKCVSAVSSNTKEIVVISDKMAEDYRKIFTQPIHTIRIAAKKNPYSLPSHERSGIVYAGGLGVNRVKPLVELGRALNAASISGFEYIDVYSNDKKESTLAQLTEENGIRFHGGISGAKVPEIIGRAKYLLHVEAFDETAKARTRYSLSTKIGESLCSGACLLAYGPKDISSIEYLKRNSSAFILESAEDFPSAILKLEHDPMIREQLVENAQKLANECHNKEKNDKLLREIFCKAVTTDKHI